MIYIVSSIGEKEYPRIKQHLNLEEDVKNVKLN
jgi:hypothetical protein